MVPTHLLFGKEIKYALTKLRKHIVPCFWHWKFIVHLTYLSGGSGGAAQGDLPPPFLLVQTEGRRAKEFFFFWHRAPPLWMITPHPLIWRSGSATVSFSVVHIANKETILCVKWSLTEERKQWKTIESSDPKRGRGCLREVVVWEKF